MIPTSPPPLKVNLGERGEFTLQQLAEADLTPEERARAAEILHVQEAYLRIVDTAGGCVIDPEGNTYDLSAMKPAVWALAWTLALAGARFSAEPHIKRKLVTGDHLPPGTTAWVDVRADDDTPLVAPPPPVENGWDGVRPAVKVSNVPRPEWME